MARADRRILVSFNLRYILHSTLTGDSPFTLPVKRDAFRNDTCSSIGMLGGTQQRVMVTKIRSYPDDAAPLVRPVASPNPSTNPAYSKGVKEGYDVTRLLSSVSKSPRRVGIHAPGKTRL
jgi:hypothetical protein